MNPRKAIALIFLAAGTLLVGRTLLAEDIVLVPGTISGTVTSATLPITQVQVNASSQTVSSSLATPFSSAGALSIPYSMTVSAPQTGSANYTVNLTIFSDNNRDFIRPSSAVVSVSSVTPGVRDYALPETGIISPVFTVTGGVTVSSASLNAFFSAPGIFEQAFTNGSAGTNFVFSAIPRSNMQLNGSVTLSNGLQVPLPSRTINVVAGQTTEVAYSIDGSATGSIGGTIAFTGPLPIQRIDAFASGPQFRSIVQQPPPSNATYSIGPLIPGNYFLNVTARFNNFDDAFDFPNAAYSPGRFSQAVGSGQTPVDVTAEQAFINGTLQLSGASSYLPFISSGSTVMAGVPTTAAAGGSSSDQLTVASRAFDVVVSAGGWRLSRTTVNFFRAAPGLSGGFSYFPNSPSTLTVAAGETLNHDIPLDLGEVTLTITASEGSTFSNPSVNGFCIQRDASNNLLWQTNVNFSTFNLTNVSQGTVPIVGPSGLCTLTPRVIVNNQTVALPNVSIDVVAGTSQTVDVGGPTLTITSPAPEALFSFSSITVSGKASDDVAVASVMVNGQAASLSSSNNPAIPSEVNFFRSIGLVRGPNVITTVASDTSNPAKTATDTRTVYFDTAIPSLVIESPANGLETVASTVTVSGRADDDAGVKKITVNGVEAALTPGGSGNLVLFGSDVPLAIGSNTITVIVTDISNRTRTGTLSVTREQRAPTSLAVAPASGVYGGTATVSATLTSEGSAVASKPIAFSINGVQANAVTDASGVATASISISGLNAGSHPGAVSASFAQDDEYLASSGSADLTVAKAAATLTIGNLSHTYDGLPKAAGVTTTPAGLTTVAISYNGGAAAPINAGSYDIVATLDNPNYEAAPANATLTIEKATATLTLGGLSHVYDGSGKAATVTTSPSGLGVITVTYEGGAGLPVNAGSHAVVAALSNANYHPASANGTLVIAKAAQTIAFAALPNNVFGDAPFDVAATASSDLPVAFAASGTCTVTGSTVTLTSGGSCTITASQGGNANFEPAAPVSRAFHVVWTWTNVLPPINVDGSSVFKLNSTVPVKFALTDASAEVSMLSARIFLAKIGSGVLGTELEPTSTSAADIGNTFRYDAAEGQYIFNLGTKQLSQGTWQLRIDLGDGSTNVVLISLKK